MTRDTSHSQQSDAEQRKRASKACDRCKFKKVKCCGSKPCSRCQSDDTVCNYGNTNKSDVKLVSAARANQLQFEQQLLVKALRVLWGRYSKTFSANDGLDLGENPSVHDIIKSLGLMDDSLHDSLTQRGLDLAGEVTGSGNSSQDSPQVNDAIGNGRSISEDANIALPNYLVDPAQHNEQLWHSSQSDVFSGNSSPGVYSLPEMSMMEGLEIDNRSLDGMQRRSSTIANRRGYRDMPSLGPLPIFDTSPGGDHWSASGLNKQHTGPCKIDALGPSQFGLQLFPQLQHRQHTAQGIKADDAMLQFTNITPA